VPERMQMLTRHRELVEAQIVELGRSLALIDHKIAFYADAIAAPGGER
jgi:hypothetical protein